MQSTVMPTSASISPIAWASARAASIAEIGALSYSASNAGPPGNSGHSGAFIRATRPPS